MESIHNINELNDFFLINPVKTDNNINISINVDEIIKKIIRDKNLVSNNLLSVNELKSAEEFYNTYYNFFRNILKPTTLSIRHSEQIKLIEKIQMVIELTEDILELIQFQLDYFSSQKDIEEGNLMSMDDLFK